MRIGKLCNQVSIRAIGRQETARARIPRPQRGETEKVDGEPRLSEDGEEGREGISAGIGGEKREERERREGKRSPREEEGLTVRRIQNTFIRCNVLGLHTQLIGPRNMNAKRLRGGR